MGKAGSAPSFPIPRDVPVLEQPRKSHIPVFHLFPPWEPKAADQWEIFSQGVIPGWMELGNDGSCPCPWQGLGMGSSLRSLPTQKFWEFTQEKNPKQEKKNQRLKSFIWRGGKGRVKIHLLQINPGICLFQTQKQGNIPGWESTLDKGKCLGFSPLL